MTDDPLSALEAELGRMIAAVAPARRKALALRIGRALRQAQVERIAAQRNPDGTPFAPRKPRVPSGTFRGNRGGIRRRAATRAMFSKLRQARWLRIDASADEVAVGFVGSAARIARVHQLGLRDRVSREAGAPEAAYPARVLLGLTPGDVETVLALVTAELAGD